MEAAIWRGRHPLDAHVIIRDFAADDYAYVARIHNALFPKRARTAEAWEIEDKARNPKCRARRWIASLSGEIVGFAGYSQSLFGFDPGKFHVAIEVLPSHQCQGIGAALYDRVIAGLESFDLSRLRADGFANLPEGVRFMERRGFVEVFRERPLHLYVSTFDPDPHVGIEERLRDEGIEIRSLSELDHDLNRDRKLYDLYWEATADVPKENPVKPMAFDEWAEWTLNDPSVAHEGYFVAVCGESFVGISEFGSSTDGDALWAGLVGVRQGYRNRGIAQAMQLRAIRYARTHRYPVIKTSTSVMNLPMLAVYGRLGFRAQPDWIQLEKVLDN